MISSRKHNTCKIILFSGGLGTLYNKISDFLVKNYNKKKKAFKK